MEVSSLELCTEAVVPDEVAAEAVEYALLERPNVELVPLPGSRRDRPRLALQVTKLWKPGRRLRVRFLDGDPSVQERVARESVPAIL